MKSLNLTELYPPFGLAIRTPSLVLQVADDARAAELARNAMSGIHDKGFYPFATPWTDDSPEAVARAVFNNSARARGWRFGEPWRLNFTVHLRDSMVPVGVMDLRQQDDSPCAVSTGSWLLKSQHGKGYGTQARAAVLKLAFDGFGSTEAITRAYSYNLSSLGVTRKLGYTRDSSEDRQVNGKTVECILFTVSPDAFRSSEVGSKMLNSIWWTGLDSVLEYFHVTPKGQGHVE